MDKFCEPHHLIIVIIVLILAIVALGGGKGLGSLLGPLFKKVLGKGNGVNINVGENHYSGPERRVGGPACPLPQCPDHSLVAQFMKQSEEDRHRMWARLDEIRDNQMQIKAKVEMLLQGARIRWNAGIIPPDK